MKKGDFSKLSFNLINSVAFGIFLLTVGLVTYINDVPVTHTPVFFYEYKVMGLDPLDWLTLFLIILVTTYLIIRNEISVTRFHKYILVITLVYIIGMIVGFIYGLIYDYPFNRWVQDFQRPFYLFVYFFITFELLSDVKRFKIFLYYLFGVIILKAMLIAINTFGQRNWWLNLGHRWTVTTYGTDLVILSLIFFIPMSYLFFYKNLKNYERLLFGLLVLLYILITIAGLGRTILVLFLFSTIYMIFEMTSNARLKFFVTLFVVLISIVLYFQFLQPKFLERFSRHFGSIFNLAVSQENLSNATRIVEIKNIVNRLFVNASLLQGMGLGAWWDDKIYKLPPFDFGSGFIGSNRYFYTHLLFLSQLLQIGLIGTIIFWILMGKMFFYTREVFKRLSENYSEKALLLGLNIVYLNFALCMANYLRVFFFIGLFLGLIARLLLFVENKVE